MEIGENSVKLHTRTVSPLFTVDFSHTDDAYHIGDEVSWCAYYYDYSNRGNDHTARSYHDVERDVSRKLATYKFVKKNKSKQISK